MSSTDSDNESDEERLNDVVYGINLHEYEELVQNVLDLYTSNNYRWIAGVSAYTIMQTIKSPSFVRESIKTYMKKDEWKDFKRAAQRKTNATPFMMTFIDIICDLFSACDEVVTWNKCLVFLSNICEYDTNLRPVVTKPLRRPAAPAIVDCHSVSLSKNIRNRPHDKVRTIAGRGDIESKPIYSPIVSPIQKQLLDSRCCD